MSAIGFDTRVGTTGFPTRVVRPVGPDMIIQGYGSRA
jgi:hypothetical protein